MKMICLLLAMGFYNWPLTDRCAKPHHEPVKEYLTAAEWRWRTTR